MQRLRFVPPYCDFYTAAEGSGVLRSVRLSVCVSVCDHISGTAGPIFTKFVTQIPCGRGSVLLWRRCATLCTSVFVDDVTFGRSGPYGDAWKAEPQPTTTSGVAIPGGVELCDFEKYVKLEVNL